ncbi:hypothetical protein PQX77_019423 [Marasmius sp. AFHP31]|nr:hypothetical protein PQX77_019423 [Marasmius sp. AFHP31]
MSGPTDGTYYILNVDTKKYAQVGDNNYIVTNGSTRATFDIAHVAGQGDEIYTIQDRNSTHYVGAEGKNSSPRKVELKQDSYQWAFQWTDTKDGTGAWKIGLKLDNVWWDDMSSDPNFGGIALVSGGAGDVAAWRLVPVKTN